MDVVVKEARGTEHIASDREELVKNLEGTATPEYAAQVLKWFDEGHKEGLQILNGAIRETWLVKDDAPATA